MIVTEICDISICYLFIVVKPQSLIEQWWSFSNVYGRRRRMKGYYFTLVVERAIEISIVAVIQDVS